MENAQIHPFQHFNGKKRSPQGNVSNTKYEKREERVLSLILFHLFTEASQCLLFLDLA